jgi:3-sulfinopropanoyl-CoA desulfinase
MVRDARMFTIGGGTAQILRTVVASRILGRKLPQARDGYLENERAARKTNF